MTPCLARAVGIDLNEDHRALAETDRFGNLVEIRRTRRNLYGKREKEAKAIFARARTEITRT
ncbi:hypothetical protein MPNT_280009 [Candidatus Methylacidithermus pantelleriae]|uniref:Transposase n=1 Tax=Candidatus Methylacidithermus pantelleriae TaxID=2744239 RepID=A0A8J2FNW4_9BACT|nr:hypothetical protein MPNT_280009 [Candidatus Methylacidithermus pantelleriae]